MTVTGCARVSTASHVGSGTFRWGPTPSVPGTPDAVAVSDLNGDGKADRPAPAGRGQLTAPDESEQRLVGLAAHLEEYREGERTRHGHKIRRAPNRYPPEAISALPSTTPRTATAAEIRTSAAVRSRLRW